MRKKLCLILCCVLVFLCFPGCNAAFSAEPTTNDSTPVSIPIDVTLNATKFNSDGNEIGTTQITIHGEKLDYPTQEDLLDIEIDPFDGWGSFVMLVNESTGLKGEYNSTIDNANFTSLYDISAERMQPCVLYFSNNFDYCVLVLPGACTYLASTDSNHTADKVLEYFANLGINMMPNK